MQELLDSYINEKRDQIARFKKFEKDCSDGKNYTNAIIFQALRRYLEEEVDKLSKILNEATRAEGN